MPTPEPGLRLVEQSQTEERDANIGQTLDGRYLIERLIGKGGMGLVYQAKHVMLGKRIAVKVLKEEVSNDEEVMARFRREAQSASAIGSQHICDVSDFGTLPDGSTYFVMEYLDGPSLKAALEEENPMPVPRILDIASQLCEALGAAHDRGIVHRDLKPDNIHLVKQGNRDGFVKVLDFGIAKVGGASAKKLTQAGKVFGTPHYMSPEQCSGSEVDHRTDIYAIGVMLYEMSCGRVPFDADNLMGVLTKHVYENPIPPREFPPPVQVPPGLEAIILKCLAKQADQRYQTMAELKADLQAVARGETPDAVVHAALGAVLPKTQMISSDSVPHLVGTVPGAPSSQFPSAMPAEVEATGSRVGLVIAAVFAMVALAGVAFGAAFFIGFGDEAEAADSVAEVTPSGTSPVEEAPPEPAPTVEEPAEPADDVPVEAAPAEPTVVIVTVSSDPAGAEVYGEDGSLLGNTPFELERPARGDEPVRLTLRHAGFEERTVPVSHLSQTSLSIGMSRVRRGGRRGGSGAAAQPVPQPQIRPLAPAPRPPPPRASGRSNSEIISPW